MILNPIERYDYEFHWKIWFWIQLKGMTMNSIGRYDFECYWILWFEWYGIIWFWISLKDMIFNFIRNYEKYYEYWYQVCHSLIKV